MLFRARRPGVAFAENSPGQPETINTYSGRAHGLLRTMQDKLWKVPAWDEVGKPGQREAAAGGGESGPQHAGPWEGLMLLWGVPARAALLCSHPLKEESMNEEIMNR